jgi:hypothetical protein
LPLRGLLFLLVFLLLCAILFLFSSRWVFVYDEGIAATGAMRILAGQVPHRDFYYNYGAGTLYLLAGLFKFFGSSVLVERLTGIFLATLVIFSVYVLARKYCGPRVAILSALLGFLWTSADLIQGFGPPLLCIPLLWSTWLIVPVTNATMQRRRAFGAGLLVALVFLFRYDMGVGVACAHALATFIFAMLRADGSKKGLRWIAGEMWPYPMGVVTVLAVPVLGYLTVAPLHDLLYDVFLFQAKYYRTARGLPLPRLTYAALPDCVIYLAPVLIVIAIYAIARELRRDAKRSVGSRELPSWIYLLIAFSSVSAMVFVKGVVRASAGQMYPCTVCCLLILAVLLEQRRRLGATVKIPCALLGVLFAVTGCAAMAQKISFEKQTNSSVLKWMIFPSKAPPTPPFRRWCSDGTPITRGFCYVLSPGHIQTIEFLRSQTRPGDLLFVGLPHHDRIFINDNITYFATQLLPATKWSHFDPFLQNRLDIQQEMVRELEKNRPTYVVLDAEFEMSREPNGSSTSTGVHLLDDYIAAHYTPVRQFGELTISQRK